MNLLQSSSEFSSSNCAACKKGCSGFLTIAATPSPLITLTWWSLSEKKTPNPLCHFCQKLLHEMFAFADSREEQKTISGGGVVL